MFSPGSYQSEEVWPQLARSPYPPSPFCLGQASPLSSSPSQFLFAKQLTQICSISPPSAPGALCKPDQPNTHSLARIHRNVSKHARSVCFFPFFRAALSASTCILQMEHPTPRGRRAEEGSRLRLAQHHQTRSPPAPDARVLGPEALGALRVSAAPWR